jgi:hypothetical protein
VVRKPLGVSESSSRTLDQRLAIKVPALNTAMLRLRARLPPSSGLRQAALWDAVRKAIEAYNRRDLVAASIGFHPGSSTTRIGSSSRRA